MITNCFKSPDLRNYGFELEKPFCVGLSIYLGRLKAV